jgi:hypothetical protein
MEENMDAFKNGQAEQSETFSKSLKEDWNKFVEHTLQRGTELVEKAKAGKLQDAAEATMGPNDWLQSAETTRQRKAETERNRGIDPLKAIPPLVADNALGKDKSSDPSPFAHKTLVLLSMPAPLTS